MSKTFTLNKRERVKSRKQTEQLFATGSRISAGPLRLIYLITDSPVSLLQFGTGVSSRTFKKATDRNRIKRIIRESWRLQRNQLKEKLVPANKSMAVFFLYTGKDIPSYQVLFEKMGQAIIRLCDLL